MIFKKTFLFLLACGLIAIFSCTSEKEEVIERENLIWYAQPATTWMQALPIGNGRLGAMVFGGTDTERIQLNEDSMWAGGPDWPATKGTPEDLEEIRKLIENGNVHEADKEIVERFSYKTVLRSHQTMGDLFIDFPKNRKIENYQRNLNLDKALVSTSYVANGAKFTEKVFSSAVDDVLVIQLSSENKNGIDFNLKLSRPEDHGHPTVTISNPKKDEISMTGMVTQFGGKRESKPYPIDFGVKFETRLKVKTDGSVRTNEGVLELKNIKKATIYIVGNTSFYHENFQEINTETLKKLETKTFQAIVNDHITNYQKLYKRVNFDLGNHALDSVATDKRLERIKNGVQDYDLEAKLFQYGRYLLISSSRPGTNPANLQGLWNEHIEAPWNADYHVNINLQMNYWPADVTNLSECNEPLFRFVDRLIDNGRTVAKNQYGIQRGSMIHHTTDLWATAWMRAEQAYWGSWIHGGGWLAQHYWEHYRYTKNIDFLKHRAYPAMKAIAEFYLDWLVKDEKSNTWVSTPETSPENSYVAKDGKPAAVSFGSAMGHQIISEVFDNVTEAGNILGKDSIFLNEVKKKRKNLHPGVVIGKDGRILEWNEPFEEHEKGHRHMSHLYALHPGDEITAKNSAAFEAAKKTIAYRLEHGGAGTGWSRAWMINLNARLFDAKAAQENIKKFLQISVADNLFDEHPPFQIDGNFGYTAAVAELLLQSHEGFIRILPTLPPNWKNGKMEGLIARGNIEVNIYWENGNLQKIGLKAKKNQSSEIVYKNNTQKIILEKNKTIWLDKNLQQLLK